ncbi:MAG TPA: hypothetical protein VNB23_01950 [Ramlibacter sp.]|nr:hypothetical protein [Ramlibacter sp.]
MWKKALVLFVAMFALLWILDTVLVLAGMKPTGSGMGVAVGVIYSMLANTDYYRLMVLGHRGWW